MNRLASSIVLSCLLAGASACTTDRTEVVLVIGSDLDVPAEIDGLRVEVTDPGGQTQQSTADLSSAGLPRTLGLVHRGGPLGPYRARVVGTLGASTIIERVAVFTFVEEQTLMLRVDLLRSCLTEVCADGETCAASGCRSEIVQASELVPWTGNVGTNPNMDGGPIETDAPGPPPDSPEIDSPEPPPSDSCVSSPEVCNGEDDDCDGMTDEGFDLMTDVDNCGMCDNVCNLANATAGCSGGMCTITACTSADFADCDTDPMNGCEVDLRSTGNHCGSCTNSCGGSTRNCCMSMCARDPCP